LLQFPSGAHFARITCFELRSLAIAPARFFCFSREIAVRHWVAGLLWAGVWFGIAGCNPVPPPNGALSAVQTLSDRQRVGNVYIVRGLFGNFSTGMDELQADLEAAGIRAVVYQHLQATSLAKRIADTYRASGEHEPLVLVGHSLGADSIVDISRHLEREQVAVQLLVTVDPVYADPVPGNVARAVNYYISNGPLDLFPALRGIRIKRAEGADAPLENVNLRDHPNLSGALTNHFTIDSNPKVRQAIVQQVLTVCEPRPAGEAGINARLPGTRPEASRTAWTHEP
jgi:hypothetical protein